MSSESFLISLLLLVISLVALSFFRARKRGIDREGRRQLDTHKDKERPRESEAVVTTPKPKNFTEMLSRCPSLESNKSNSRFCSTCGLFSENCTCSSRSFSYQKANLYGLARPEHPIVDAQTQCSESGVGLPVADKQVIKKIWDERAEDISRRDQELRQKYKELREEEQLLLSKRRRIDDDRASLNQQLENLRTREKELLLREHRLGDLQAQAQRDGELTPEQYLVLTKNLNKALEQSRHLSDWLEEELQRRTEGLRQTQRELILYHDALTNPWREIAELGSLMETDELDLPENVWVWPKHGAKATRMSTKAFLNYNSINVGTLTYWKPITELNHDVRPPGPCVLRSTVKLTHVHDFSKMREMDDLLALNPAFVSCRNNNN